MLNFKEEKKEEKKVVMTRQHGNKELRRRRSSREKRLEASVLCSAGWTMSDHLTRPPAVPPPPPHPPYTRKPLKSLLLLSKPVDSGSVKSSETREKSAEIILHCLKSRGAQRLRSPCLCLREWNRLNGRSAQAEAYLPPNFLLANYLAIFF